MTLNNFRETCPKCEYGLIEIEYRLPKDPSDELYIDLLDRINTEEHLACRCDRCGYCWTMKTADDPKRSHGLKPH